jgi:AcrR family transcriptional regulator
MTGRRNRRDELVAAAVRLAARQGVHSASVRDIASEAGVTEGALYRHFDSKDDLCQQAYQQIVAEMIVRATHLPLCQRLSQWIRLSYEYFDGYPEAFTYVLLTPYDFAESDITRRQGRLLTELLTAASRGGEFPESDPVLAMCHFSGIMLNVPRLINEGILEGPATRYVEDVTKAVCSVFGLTPQPVLE